MSQLRIPSFKSVSAPAAPLLMDWRVERREEALSSFNAFLPYWWFINRENGQPMRFTPETMWRGQQELAEIYERHGWVFALKAGKLGFTQLEIAWDAYRGLRIPNSRVHLFSMNQQASISLLEYVKYGMERLPAWFQAELRGDLAGGEKTQSLKVSVGSDRSDVRTWVSYAAGDNVSIDQTCAHAHVDEMARMDHPEKTWAAIQSTVSPIDGTCHIVTRGQGESDFLSADPGGLWPQSLAGAGKLFGYFAPYSYRPDRDQRWFERESATMTPQQMAWFAPEDPEDAFAGDANQIFVPIEWWDALADLNIPPLLPGDRTPLVLGLDAAVTGDCFAITAVGRNPAAELFREHLQVRACNIWKPSDFGGRIDFDFIERFLRTICKGGCTGYLDARGLLQQHPRSRPEPETCPACAAESWQEPFNVVCIAYDPHELEQMAQRLRRDRVAWMFEFNQGDLRLQADKALYDLIVWRRISHTGQAVLREHIDNAKAKVPKDDDKKMRIIKKSPARKIDGAVSLSMAAFKCLELNIPRSA